jgi:hypothetical protein
MWIILRISLNVNKNYFNNLHWDSSTILSVLIVRTNGSASSKSMFKRSELMCFGEWGTVCSVGFWEGTFVFFWGRWYREWEEKSPRPMEFELCSLHVAPSNRPNLCIYVLYYVLCYINSLCSGGFADETGGMCWFDVWWGYGTDVSRTGCARLVRQLDVSPCTCHWSVEVYVSQGPHQGAMVVFGYIKGSFLVNRTGDERERHDPNI